MKQILTLIVVMFCVTASAQKRVVADTIDAESLADHRTVTQHQWSKYEYVDTCTTRYAVVHDWNGRCGIYDLEKKENITELEYRNLFFSKMMELDDGSQETVFYGYKGHREGIVSVAPSGDILAITMPDKEQMYSLDSCRTIDKKITKLSHKLLKKDMKECGGHYGQVLVMESQTGNIKAWVALEDENHNGHITDALLLKHQLCSDPMKPLMATIGMVDSHTSWSDSIDTKFGIDSVGDMRIRDHNWHRGGYGKVSFLDGFKWHSNIAMIRAMERRNPASLRHDWWRVADCPREMDALEIAQIYNVAALNGKTVIETSVNTDSIKVNTPEAGSTLDQEIIKMFREYLYATLNDGGIGSRWTSKKVHISGDYVVHRNCRPTLYDDNADQTEQYYSEEGLETYNQVIFTGFFPSDNPRYTICVSMDKTGMPIAGKLISNTVNKLAEYLNKH